MKLTFLVPGALNQLTGGYVFDRKVVECLRALGRGVDVIELSGRYPAADNLACTAAQNALASLPSGSPVVIDGLALPAFDACLDIESKRLNIIGFIHHPLFLETGLSAADASSYAELEARLWRLLRGIICPSAHTSKAVIAAGVSSVRVAISPPGTGKVVRASERRSSTQLQLLAVGTVTQRKGHLLLIEALAGLRDELENIDWKLTCIGSVERDPVAANAAREAIAANQLEDRVLLAGEQPQEFLTNTYERADIFVLPSYHEGYGMVFTEAMAHGLPIISTTAGAIPDTVPAAAALLVEPGDAGALRDALRSVMIDGELRARLAAGARQAAAELPDWDAAVLNWSHALDRLLAA
ncbi:MAG: glycosyltransferase family 1 protein [Verrucomicrobiaceae bacterium]|nr:glycosyltransferase family 1 protein [Verrucomicrobiaceae bacterium]